MPTKFCLVKALVFPVVMYGCEIWAIKKAKCWRIDAFDQLPLVLENNLQSLKSPLDCKEIQPIHPKGIQSWIFIGRINVEAETPNTLATWCKELTHLKKSWCWERLKARREGDGRGWDGWMASLTQWTWVWVSSRSWWWTRKPVVVHSMRLQRVGHEWATELNNALIVWKFCRDVLWIWLGCCPDATLVIWRETEGVMSASHSHPLPPAVLFARKWEVKENTWELALKGHLLHQKLTIEVQFLSVIFWHVPISENNQLILPT